MWQRRDGPTPIKAPAPSSTRMNPTSMRSKARGIRWWRRPVRRRRVRRCRPRDSASSTPRSARSSSPMSRAPGAIPSPAPRSEGRAMSLTGERTPLPPSFVQRAVEGVRYIITGVTPSTWFGPLQPLAPMAPADVAGRQLDYPVGYNLTVTPRSEERISFAQLRALADGYDLLRTVIHAPDDVSSPAPLLNPLIDAIESALSPTIPTNTQTLGGLVEHA